MIDKEKCPKPIVSQQRFGTGDPFANILTESKMFYEIDPLEMARQLTLVEHELFCKVQAYECIDQIWESHYRKEMASYKQTKPIQFKRHLPGSPNSDISKLIRHTNEVILAN